MRPPRKWPRPSEAEVECQRRRGFWRADRTVLDDIVAVCRERPDQVAVHASLHDQDRVIDLTYGALDRCSDALADALAGAGVGPGHVVSVQMPNWWQMPVVYLAALKIGAVIHPIPPIHDAREVSRALQIAESAVLVVAKRLGDRDLRPRVDDALAMLSSPPVLLWVDPALKPEESVWEVASEAPSQGDRRSRQVGSMDPDSAAQLMFTSGSTGSPKGVVHTHNTLWAAVTGVPNRLGLDRSDRILVPSTMGHQTGFLYGLSMPLIWGVTAVYQDVWNAARFVDLVNAYGVSVVSGSATFVMDACEEVERSGADLPSLRVFRSGGAPVPRSLVSRCRDVLGARLLTSWGMTENGVCTMSSLNDDAEAVSQSDGGPMEGVELRVVDPDGERLPAGIEGSLELRSPSMCLGYLTAEGTFEPAAGRDGWFGTGDRGYLSETGNLRITGRDKDLIIRGGENIPVADVENTLYLHPDVRAVAVVAVPDARLGERACALIVTKTGTNLTVQDVRDHLRTQHMARQFWPEYVVNMPSLPMTPAGKIQKHLLRDLIANEEVLKRGAL